MTWADLFADASEYDVTPAQIRTTLAARREEEDA
jgi:hypothetical protein